MSEKTAAIIYERLVRNFAFVPSSLFGPVEPTADQRRYALFRNITREIEARLAASPARSPQQPRDDESIDWKARAEEMERERDEARSARNTFEWSCGWMARQARAPDLSDGERLSIIANFPTDLEAIDCRFEQAVDERAEALAWRRGVEVVMREALEQIVDHNRTTLGQMREVAREALSKASAILGIGKDQ